jgi:energy-coupling factor transporter ATP-binding protein EcfA2
VNKLKRNYYNDKVSFNYMFNISFLTFTNGPRDSATSLKISSKKIIILVGPNNSGKSTILMDIEKWFKDYNNNNTMKILRKIDISFSEDPHEYNEFEQNILEFRDGDEKKNDEVILLPLVKKHPFEDNHSDPIWYNLEDIKNKFNECDVGYFKEHFLSYFIIRLDGKTRFELTKSQPYSVFRTNRTSFNYLTRLYDNNEDLKKLGNIVFKEFYRYPYLIKKNGDNYINIVLGRTGERDIITSPFENKDKVLDSLLPISEFGDGINCFIGICLSILSYPFRIVLLDEPEAYLHPSSSYSLGKNLAQWVEEKHRSLVVSTHSAEFLLGCLEATPNVTIIRLTYDGNNGYVSELSAEDIKIIIDNPLLRSNNLLNALFHKYVIIVEGNVDRVFYSAINTKMIEIDEMKGMNDIIFINSVGKNVIHKMVEPLKKINVPLVSIYDFDILDEREGNKGLFKQILRINNISETKIASYLEQQIQLEKYIKISNLIGSPDPYRHEGINFLKSPLKENILQMLNELKNDGIFIIPYGRVENWLESYNIREKGSQWLLQILPKLKDITSIPEDNIWMFMSDIKGYLTIYK